MSSPRGSGPSASLPPSWMPSAGNGEREVRGVFEGRKREICYAAPERDWKGGHAPLPHTPVTRLSAAHSGSARPTPTDDANGPVGILRSSLSAPAQVHTSLACRSPVDTSPLGSRQILVGRNPWFIDRRFPFGICPTASRSSTSSFTLVAQKRRYLSDAPSQRRARGGRASAGLDSDARDIGPCRISHWSRAVENERSSRIHARLRRFRAQARRWKTNNG